MGGWNENTTVDLVLYGIFALAAGVSGGVLLQYGLRNYNTPIAKLYIILASIIFIGWVFAMYLWVLDAPLSE